MLVLRQHRLALQQQALQPHGQRHVSGWAVGRRAAREEGAGAGEGAAAGSGVVLRDAQWPRRAGW